MPRGAKKREPTASAEGTLSYSEAKSRLEEIQAQIEGEEAALDELPVLLKEAKGLIAQCRQHIRSAAVELERFEADLKQAEVEESPTRAARGG